MVGIRKKPRILGYFICIYGIFFQRFSHGTKLGAKKFLRRFKSKGEDLFQARTDDDRMNEATQKSKRNLVMNPVSHANAPWDGFKKMFVVPNGVGAYTLLVYKVLHRTNVG